MNSGQSCRMSADEDLLVYIWKIYRRKWFLSDKGMQAAQQMDAKIADAVSTIGLSLTEEERTAFYEMLNKVNTFMVNYLEEKR